MTSVDTTPRSERLFTVGKAISAFVRRRVAGNLLMVLAIGAGIWVATGLDVQMMSDVDVKRIDVRVAYPGSSPAEIEESITRRIEERLIGLSGVSMVRSYASAEYGVVQVDVEALARTKDVMESVRAEVLNIPNFPPRDAEAPTISLAEIVLPAITVALSSDMLSTESLREAAEKLREDMIALPSVTKVELDWSPTREIAIEIDEEALLEHNLSILEVARTIQNSSIDLGTGHLLTNLGGVAIRVEDRRIQPSEFEDIVLLTTRDGGEIRVGDVATARERFGDDVTNAYLNGVPAVFVTAQASLEQESELEIAKEVQAMLANYEAPPGTDLMVWQDTSRRTTSHIDMLMSTAILGIVLVFLVLALVFDLRMATWVAVGVGVSFIGAIAFFPIFGITFNIASMFVMIIMIGIVVDDAVVVGESIATEREKGRLGVDAAALGARRVFWPVVVGVSTTFFAFIPLYFTYGTMGQLISVFPIIVGLILAVSLIEAFLILPSHLSHDGTWSRWPLVVVQERVRALIERLRDRVTIPAVAFSTRRPGTVMVIAVLVVAIGGSLVPLGLVRFGEIVPVGTSLVDATLKYPIGTSSDVVRHGTEILEEAAIKTNERLEGEPILAILKLVGHHPSANFTASSTSARHLAAVSLRVKEEHEREYTLQQIVQEWHRQTGEIPQVEQVAFSYAVRLTAKGFDVSVGLTHPNRELLMQIVEELVAEVRQNQGVVSTDHSMRPGMRQFDVRLTPAGRAAGLNAESLATQLRGRFIGIEVQRVQRGREEIKVNVRYPESQRKSFDELMDERIETPMGVGMPLQIAAAITETQELDTLARFEGLPAVELGMAVDSTVVTPREALSQVEEEIEALMERYPDLNKTWALTGADSDEYTLGPLVYTFPVVLLIIYIMIAVLFRSYVQPLIVLTAMPLAAAGAVVAHFILGYDLTIASLFGVVAVLGVVINDTLLLIDRSNSIRDEKNLPAIAAVSGAVQERFRPIFLTTVTTVIGLMPVLFRASETFSTSYVPIVVSIIGGLIAGSISILFVVPAIMLLGETFRERAGWERRSFEEVAG